MNEPKAIGAEKMRQRRMMLASLLMMVFAVSIFGGIGYLRRQAANGNYPRAKRSWEDPQVAAALTQVRIAKATMLREKYRSWALQHQDVLKQMLHAPSNDQSAMEVVWDTLPSDPGPSGAGISGSDLHAGTTVFSWEPVGKDLLNGQVRMTPAQRKQIESYEPGLKRERAEQFKNLHDLKISESANSGQSTICLWASGRVTENKWIDNPHLDHGKPWVVQAPPRQVLPPYEFVQ